VPGRDESRQLVADPERMLLLLQPLDRVPLEHQLPSRLGLLRGARSRRRLRHLVLSPASRGGCPLAGDEVADGTRRERGNDRAHLGRTDTDVDGLRFGHVGTLSTSVQKVKRLPKLKKSVTV